MIRWHFNLYQALFSAMQLPMPIWVWWNVTKNRKRAKERDKKDDDIPVLLPIYNYLIYLDIIYIIAKFLLFGFLYDHMKFGRQRTDPVYADTFMDAFLYMSMGEGATVLCMVAVLEFQCAPSAGKYALRKSCYKSLLYFSIYVGLNCLIMTSRSTFSTTGFLTQIEERTAYFVVKLFTIFLVVFYLASVLVHMYRVKSSRWGVWLYRSVWVTLILWTCYVVVTFSMLLKVQSQLLYITLGYTAVIFYDFIIPLFYYFALCQDSKYWRNLEKFLLPTKSISLKDKLLEHDWHRGLQPMAIAKETGSFTDNFSHFNIPLIDFVQLESAHSILGKGGNAIVWKGFLRGEAVAVKEMKQDKISVAGLREFCREALLSTKCHHPNILKFFGVCIAPPQFLLVFEWCNRGDLGGFLATEENSLTAGNRLHLAVQAAKAVLFFHKEGLVHRDLKPQNFLVHQEKGKTCVKLADFGSCRSAHDLMPLFQGISPLFAAPEIRKMIPEDLRKLPQNAASMTIRYGAETDVFSFGWVLWSIMYHDDWKTTLRMNYKRIMHGWTPRMKHNFTPEIKEIVNKCWTVDPKVRPDMKEIYEDLSALRTSDEGSIFASQKELTVLEEGEGKGFRRSDLAHAA